MKDGRTAWYLGGQIAESGVDLASERQIELAKQELAEVLPWIDLDKTEWSSLRIERAEPKTAGGLRPESCYLDSNNGILTVWPTKLAFAPRLAQEVLATLEKDGVVPNQYDHQGLSKLSKADLAQPPWEV
jgi:hypothetical protein